MAAALLHSATNRPRERFWVVICEKAKDMIQREWFPGGDPSRHWLRKRESIAISWWDEPGRSGGASRDEQVEMSKPVGSQLPEGAVPQRSPLQLAKKKGCKQQKCSKWKGGKCRCGRE